MYLPTAMHNGIQSEIIDVHGIMTLAVYIHYFVPGRLKIQTKLHTVRLGQLGALIDPQLDLESLAQKTRRVDRLRWLPKSEMPYPGYCRAPGSSKCLDSFCNCKALDEKWEKYVKKKEKEKRKVTK